MSHHPHLAGLEAALSRLDPTLRAQLVVQPGAVHRCYLYPDTVNAETGLANDGSRPEGTTWIGYGDSTETVAAAVDRARDWATRASLDRLGKAS